MAAASASSAGSSGKGAGSRASVGVAVAEPNPLANALVREAQLVQQAATSKAAAVISSVLDIAASTADPLIPDTTIRVWDAIRTVIRGAVFPEDDSTALMDLARSAYLAIDPTDAITDDDVIGDLQHYIVDVTEVLEEDLGVEFPGPWTDGLEFLGYGQDEDTGATAKARSVPASDSTSGDLRRLETANCARILASIAVSAWWCRVSEAAGRAPGAASSEVQGAAESVTTDTHIWLFLLSISSRSMEIMSAAMGNPKPKAFVAEKFCVIFDESERVADQGFGLTPTGTQTMIKLRWVEGQKSALITEQRIRREQAMQVKQALQAFIEGFSIRGSATKVTVGDVGTVNILASALTEVIGDV